MLKGQLNQNQGLIHYRILITLGLMHAEPIRRQQKELMHVEIYWTAQSEGLSMINCNKRQNAEG